jgi:outer membrane receptor protein involved in Fe transport
MRLRLLLICSLASCLWFTAAHADGVADEADLQFSIGADAYAKGDFTVALEHFLASNRLVPNRNVMFNIARAYEQLGKFPDAYRWYVDAGRGDGEAKLKNDVGVALGRIGPKVAVIAVESSPPGATVYLDRKDLGSVGSSPAQLGVKAGTYTIIVELPGYEPATITDIKVGIGESRPLKVPLARILGKVELAGPVGTGVRIDDEHGTTACNLPCTLDLPPGPHIAYFERAGFTVSPQTFTIVARQTIKSSASSVAVVGSLLVSADEPNALIEIDGKALGFTPAVIPNVPIGKRKVRVSLRGYVAIEREVEVKTNTQTDLRELVLTPERSVSAASRENENIEDAPASVTVISAQELEAFAYPTIMESLRGVRGFAINHDSVYGSAAVRGLGTAGDFSNRLLVLSDGAVLNENILYQPFIHYDGRTDLGDVQRIEIVRGPSSVLYGTGAVSGVVNLVLKGKDEPDGVHAQISSYDNGVARARVGYSQKFTKDAGVWLSLAGANSGGRTESLVFDSGDGQGAVGHSTAGFDKFTSYTFTGKTWYQDLQLQVFGTARSETVPTGGQAARFGDQRSFEQDQRFLAELKYDHKLSDGVRLLLRGHANYAYYHLDYWYDNDPTMPGPGLANSYNYVETYKGLWEGAEARLTLDLAKGLRLAVGAEATIHNKAEMVTGQFDTAHATFTNALQVNAPYQVLAGSALLDWRPSAAVRFQGGVRFDSYNLDGNNDAAAGTSDDARGKNSFSALSPRAVLVVKPAPTDVVKVMLGSAFRAPSAYENFYNDGGVTQLSPSACGEKLTPEHVYSAELEATHKFTTDWAGVAAGYGTLAQNIVETAPVPDACAQAAGAAGATYYRNSTTDQRMFGVDLELRREFRAGVMASAQYGAILGRYASNPNGADPTLSASTVLPNTPTQYAGVKLIVPIVQSSLNAAFRAALEDRRRLDLTSDLKTDRAVVADLVMSGLIARHGVRYAVGVYNLFNWQYAQAAASYASPLMPQPGRSVIFSRTAYR